MKTTWFKSHRLIIIVFSITILHFILTSIIGYYIAVQIGTQMGQVVAGGFNEAYESIEISEKETNRIYQNMKNDSDNIIERWKIPLLLLSLPSKPITHPMFEKIRKTWIYNPVLSREISIEQFKRRGTFVDYFSNFINSLSFGLIVYLILRLFKHYGYKHNN